MTSYSQDRDLNQEKYLDCGEIELSFHWNEWKSPNVGKGYFDVLICAIFTSNAPLDP